MYVTYFKEKRLIPLPYLCKKVGQPEKIVANRRKPTPDTERPRIDRVRDQDLPQAHLRRTGNTIRDQRERKDSLCTGLRNTRRIREEEVDQGETRSPRDLRVKPSPICGRARIGTETVRDGSIHQPHAPRPTGHLRAPGGGQTHQSLGNTWRRQDRRQAERAHQHREDTGVSPASYSNSPRRRRSPGTSQGRSRTGRLGKDHLIRPPAIR